MSENFQKDISQRKRELADALASNNKRHEADILNRLGETYASCDYGKQAIDCYQQAANIASALGDNQLESQYLLNLGNTYDWMALRQQAIDCFEQIILLSREMRQPHIEIHCLILIGNIYERQSDYESALRYLEDALKIRESNSPNIGTFLEKRIADLRQRLDPNDNI